MTTIRLVIVVFAVFVSACASAAEEPNVPSVIDVPAAPPSEVVDIPRHTLAGEQSPGAKFGAMPSWSVDPDMCANARFVRDGNTVTDSTTGLVWGAQEALAFTPASIPDPTAFANAVCNARYSGTRAATKAEIDVIAKAVPNCPLPGAFYSTDLWNVMTGDGKCLDLKTDQETRTAATCSAQPFHVDNGNDGDILRVALCVK